MRSYFQVFTGCSCVPDYFKVTEGACPVDCDNQFYIFLILLCTMQFLASTGRAGNTIIQFRCNFDLHYSFLEGGFNLILKYYNILGQ